jgi:hypothetical protein
MNNLYVYHKSLNTEIYTYINNEVDINDININSELINVIKNDKRSIVKIFNYNNKKIIVKQYKSIKNKYLTKKEFLNLCDIYFNKIVNVPEPIGCVIKYKYNIITHAYLYYYYIEQTYCNNIYKEISNFYNYLDKIDYLYTDIKLEHFIYNNGKIYIIDLDHHFKKNKYGKIKKNINRIQLINTIPQTSKFIKVKCIYYFFYYIYVNLIYIIPILLLNFIKTIYS